MKGTNDSESQAHDEVEILQGDIFSYFLLLSLAVVFIFITPGDGS